MIKNNDFIKIEYTGRTVDEDLIFDFDDDSEDELDILAGLYED